LPASPSIRRSRRCGSGSGRPNPSGLVRRQTQTQVDASRDAPSQRPAEILRVEHADRLRIAISPAAQHGLAVAAAPDEHQLEAARSARDVAGGQHGASFSCDESDLALGDSGELEAAARGSRDRSIGSDHEHSEGREAAGGDPSARHAAEPMRVRSC